jgi:hypothetical protein
MLKRLIIIGALLHILLQGSLSQTRQAFSGDQSQFTAELRTFMGPNLNENQSANLNAFITKWDSSAFNTGIMTGIIDVSNKLASRQLRPVPHFESFIADLTLFYDLKRSNDEFITWLTGLGEIAVNKPVSNDRVYNFLVNSASILKSNVLYDSPTVKWKVKNQDLLFSSDTTLFVLVENATLTCYSQKDSTEIYKVSGIYFPFTHIFSGKYGTVTWEKAGYEASDVYAEVSDYSLDITKNNFVIDSARFFNSSYFDEPVTGELSDQATGFAVKDKATFPRFKTYTTKFQINDLYKEVNYEGGLYFEGAGVRGTGSEYLPAFLTLFRNDTLYLKIGSKEFQFSKSAINSAEASMTLYLESDSIYHANLGFSYMAGNRQVNLFRTNNPVSGSPYFSSFHNIDMYFEYMSWNMNESKITLSRARGAALGQAKFESSSFYVNNYFISLMGIDEVHPLNRLIRFSQYYYSETFPIEEFAKWLNKPREAVTGLCIDLANKGFVYYDRINNEITIKQKTKDFLDFYAKRKDYDVLTINSQTKSPLDNASLNLNNKLLTIDGVRSVCLSDSQMVDIIPYNGRLVLGKNRDLNFDGIVAAGLFTIYGHDFRFSYDTFKIRLQEIDSIRIAVETGERDREGNRLIKDVNNLIQLGTAELYIDRPDNKSGLRSFSQYPIINAVTYSYIFYDDIAGLEGIYPKEDFYFRIDPFTYENIDHYTNEDLNLEGQFFAGNILEPSTQFLTIQENNSLGFNMVVPEEGVNMYDKNGLLFENLSMSNNGLVGSGLLRHLSSETRSDEFRFFPDSMLTHASSFKITRDLAGLYPELTGENVDIKWLTKEDEWNAKSTQGKDFIMFGNGTSMNGSLKMTSKNLSGQGIVDMSESRITSNVFNFASNTIKADTADYNIKSRTTSGYSFIAENANTNISFDENRSRFRLNTDSSMVMFPEVQYICTMTDFDYDMNTRILNMEQRGKSNTPLLNAEELLRIVPERYDEPTFFSTNSISDTLKFSSWKASYHLDQELIIAQNINYIPIADALIQPDSGKMTITRRARIQQLGNAIIAVNNRHLLHDATVTIESPERYSGSAVYDYVDENKNIQQIRFPEINVDTLTTTANGTIAASQKFMLSQAFSFAGDVRLSAREDNLLFTGQAGITTNCDRLRSYNIKFKSSIDPQNILIPVDEKPRDVNDNPVFSGSFISSDSLIIYPAFLSAQRSWTDSPIVNASGYLFYDKEKSTYIISSREKIADRKLAGNLVALDNNFCILSGEGKINFGAKFDLVNFASAGNVSHIIDSGKVSIEAMIGLDFFFSEEALAMMASELRLVPSLKPVSLSSELNTKGMQDLFGQESAARIREEMSLFGTSRNLPKEFNYEIFLNHVTLIWNESTSSFRSVGKIGVGLVGSQPINLYLDGNVEIQRRRSGDMIDVYLKANESTWYYFSYFRGVMMTQSGNNNYNTLISEVKANSRKHPESSVRVPYSYMIAVEDRLGRFLRRITSDEAAPLEDEPPVR